MTPRTAFACALAFAMGAAAHSSTETGDDAQGVRGIGEHSTTGTTTNSERSPDQQGVRGIGEHSTTGTTTNSERSPDQQGARGIDAQDTTETSSAIEGSADGLSVYIQRCSTCHGLDGAGTDLGPDIRQAGAAAADFQMRTGRMPLDDPDEQAVRRRPVLTPGEIEAVTAFVAGLGDGPAIPEVDLETAELQAGNEAFILNCTACHGFAGGGGNLGRGVQALSLLEATPVQVAEAMRTGPGEMPVFGPEAFDDSAVADIVAYVMYLHDPANRGGAQIGLVGPIAEGFVAVLFGVGVLLLVARWIGERRG